MVYYIVLIFAETNKFFQKKYFYEFKTMRLWPLFFQVLLYRGSHVPVQRYTPLLHNLRHRFSDLNATVAVSDYSFFKRRSFSEPTVLVGHSFGGYFALLDAKQNNGNNNIEGIVLLNSHFNSRGTAWYPRVHQNDVTVPTLTIAGGKDRYLPLRHVLSDFWEKVDEGHPRKYTKVYPGWNHFSGLDNDTERWLATLTSLCAVST